MAFDGPMLDSSRYSAIQSVRCCGHNGSPRPRPMAGCPWCPIRLCCRIAGVRPMRRHDRRHARSQKCQQPHAGSAKGCSLLRANPTAVMTSGPPPNDVSEVIPLVRLLAWLAQPTTQVATASGVLAEALPALEHRVRSRPPMQQLLVETGGRWEWAPVATALHRRLPRRMAARFLPEVDRVTAALADSSMLRDAAAAAAAADAVMASLLLVSQLS